MRQNRIVSIAIAIAVVAGVTGRGPLAAAQTTDASPAGQTTGTSAPPSGADAAEQNRSGGQFSPGGVPTKNQATTQPTVTPNGIGAAQKKPPGGDFGPGGAPTTGQAATDPSRHGRGGGAAASDSQPRE
jgi:hypothetical protein